MRVTLLGWLLVVLVGCTGVVALPTDGGKPDAGHVTDAGRVDAGAPDAGRGPDAGPADAGPVDAGPSVAGHWESADLQGHTGKLWVPTGPEGAPRPLVLMLHGCQQTPDDFAAGTRMDVLGEAQGFLVLYAGQTTTANFASCWNWFDPASQVRGSGEAQLLADWVQSVGQAHAVDAHRTYAAGFSSGGAMAVILGATYPDVFAAIFVHSGLEYAAATDSLSGSTVLIAGGPSPQTQGSAAYHAMGTHARAVPVLIFQGDSDFTNAPSNSQQVYDQWVQTDDLGLDGVVDGDVASASTNPESRSEAGVTFARLTAGSTASPGLIELDKVQSLGHAWSGGAAAGSYTQAGGPDATAHAWAFFAAHPMP
jgi:poly(hydroxyalkanoate) depolymerase family esterase